MRKNQNSAIQIISLAAVYNKNKRPVSHEQANTDPGILPLSCLLVVTLGGIQADLHREIKRALRGFMSVTSAASIASIQHTGRGIAQVLDPVGEAGEVGAVDLCQGLGAVAVI